MIEIIKRNVRRSRGKLLATSKCVDGFNWCGARTDQPRLKVTAHTQDKRHAIDVRISGADLLAIHGWLREVFAQADASDAPPTDASGQ